MPEAELNKVTLEFNNGEVRQLTGHDAANWLRQVNNVVIGQWARTGLQVLDEFDWKITKKAIDA